MNPVNFPEANTNFGPPPDLVETQCRTIPAYLGQAVGGSCDGVSVVVVAWKPDLEELACLVAGGVIYLTCLGGLPPHYLSTNFALARNPS